MAGDQTQVVAGRDILVYTVAWNTSNAIPADTVLWGTAWGTPSGQTPNAYVEKGFTKEGLRFRMNVQRQDVNVDQVVDPVLRIPQKRDLNMETRLAQINAFNLKDATGQGAITTVAAGSGTRGHDDYDVSGTITDQYITTGFDIRNPGDLEALRFVGWKGLVMADVEMVFNVSDAATIAYNVGLIPDTSTSPTRVAKFRDVLAAL